MQGIRFHQVTKRFGDVVALDHLSFEMPDGRLTGFLGPNGAGKTTSIRALLGVTRTNGGEIEVLGMNVGPDTARIVKRCGAIVEDPGHHPALTARANLEVAAATLGRGRDQIDELLHHVGLAGEAGRKVAGFSKGMRQRLGLAAALLGDPDLLVLDEPLDGLDPAGQVAFKARLRALVDEHGKTVVISSHDLRDVEQLADHVVVIDRGRLVRQGPTHELVGRRARLRVRIEDPVDATEIIESGGLEVHQQGDELVVFSDDGALVAELLAKNDRYPSALIPETDSLEKVFLSLTEGTAT